MEAKTKNKSKIKKTANKTVKKYVYCKKDYESNDGMLTSVWGPGMWHFLHTMSFNYPVSPTRKNKKEYRDFILSLQNILPCGKCRNNLKKNFSILPLKCEYLENREKFSRYIFELHEVVNKMLGKTSGLTYEIVRDRYEQFRSRCNDKDDERIQKELEKNQQKENGCVNPLYGKKTKCLLRIVPLEKKCDTFKIEY